MAIDNFQVTYALLQGWDIPSATILNPRRTVKATHQAISNNEVIKN